MAGFAGASRGRAGQPRMEAAPVTAVWLPQEPLALAIIMWARGNHPFAS